MKSIKITVFLFAMMFAANVAKASGNISFNLYPYETRDASVYTINTFLKLNNKWSYFSFVNFESSFNNQITDLAGFYTEQNLIWNFNRKHPFHINSQWVIAGGTGNDVLRFAIGWDVHETKALKDFFRSIAMRYIIHYYPFQIDRPSGYRWQIEHAYELKLFPKAFDNRVYLSGFFDHNFFKSNATTIMEHQLGIRAYKQVHAILEYRHNGYLNRNEGLAFGVEYKVNL